VAFQDKAEVDQSMTRLIRLMLAGQAEFPGTYPAVTSHDHRIINWVKAYAHHRGIAPDRFEFQMLYGIRRDLQQQLAVSLLHAPPGRAAGQRLLLRPRPGGQLSL